MSRTDVIFGHAVHLRRGVSASTPTLREAIERMGFGDVSNLKGEELPFSPGDTTAGNETELQAAVAGKKDDVDLPEMIARSNYFSNIIRRAASGDLPNRAVTELGRFTNGNRDNIWESSWVRIPIHRLGPLARRTVEEDLLADKSDPSQGKRTDMDKFNIIHKGTECLRVPVSYLLKIALADAVDVDYPLVPEIRETGLRLMGHFLSDNTSPETFSFHVSEYREGPGPGADVARETAKRFLLIQLLVAYANRRFGLSGLGQRVMVFFSPHPPRRQKILNSCISDAFYRELFMNPCLSGWDRGETKQEYMHLCHQVLSRSQMNALAKLREAGIIAHNLVVLPETSNISLANNGIHVSLGSKRLGALLADKTSGYDRRHEKYIGDLAVKIMEHFIPLFINTYSVSPYRLGFQDFHPERALGFLAHELDFTHLRMLWRRWQKKAKLNFLGYPVKPLGPPFLDGMLRALPGLKGDYIPDYRLIDYLVALMSTESSPAFNGVLFNQERLKDDLHDLGVFDRRMSLYSFIKLREYDVMGFSGMESRFYSLLPSFDEDMAKAIDLQNLLHLLAFKYIVSGGITHEHIPDEPFIESERRQIIFGRAIGIPTFFVRRDTKNLLMRKIVAKTSSLRPSHRYSGYLRIKSDDYCRVLIDIIREDGADLIELTGVRDTLDDLADRIQYPDCHSAFGRITKKVLDRLFVSSPFHLSADDFNTGLESYYRTGLREEHIREGWRHFEQDTRFAGSGPHAESTGRALRLLSGGQELNGSMNSFLPEVLSGTIPANDARKLIHLLLYTIHRDQKTSESRSGIGKVICRLFPESGGKTGERIYKSA